MKNHRVTVVTPFDLYPRKVGGAELFCYRLTAALAREGWKVRILAPCANQKTILDYAAMEIQLVPALVTERMHKTMNSFLQLSVSLLQLVFGIFYEIYSPSESILCFDSVSSIVGYPLSKIFSKKSLVRFSGGDIHSLLVEASSSREKMLRFLYKLGLLYSKRMDKIVVMSDWMANELVRFGVPRSKIVKVYNGIERQEFPQSKKNDGSIIQLIFVGSFSSVFYR